MPIFLTGLALAACNQAASTPVSCPAGAPLPSAVASGDQSRKSKATASTQNAIAPYRWRNVAIGGMGFVTGIVVHPQEPNVVYVRTDVGGVYRWNPQDSQWIPLMDGLPRDRGNLFGIESIALDAHRPNIIYAAAGGYTHSPSDVLKSSDRGETWTATQLKTPAGEPVRMGGNQYWRWSGERLAVDPNNSNVVYFGSRLDGLYRSMDGAKSWKKVTSFPSAGAADHGIPFVVFDAASSPVPKKLSERLYAGIKGQIYQSQDAGKTWQFLPGFANQNHYPQQATISADGNLYVTTMTDEKKPQGGVWKYNQQRWSQITPQAGKNYSALTLDPQDSSHLLVAEYPLNPNGIYRSITGGNHWRSLNLNVASIPWWADWHLHTLMGGLKIDPHNARRVWLTNGFGVLRTEDIAANSSNWCPLMNNLEELVVFVVKSPLGQSEAVLFSGVADMGGFRHDSLDTFPQSTLDKNTFGDTTSLDFAEADPNMIVRVGNTPTEGNREQGRLNAAYSSNGGKVWKPFTEAPANAINGKVAVSATLQANGFPVIVWAPQGQVYPVRSRDGGASWEPTRGAPNQTTRSLWASSQAIASDRVDGDLFYLYKDDDSPGHGALYRSTNGGADWQRTVANLPGTDKHAVRSTPGMRGEVWLKLAGETPSLLRSSDAGTSFVPLSNVQKVEDFTFGKPAPDRQNPTVFVYGIIHGTEGLFRSDDATSLPGSAAAATWVEVSIPEKRLGNLLYLEGDRRVFGRVYVATGGRGILYGEPILNKPAHQPTPVSSGGRP
jgi:xyloglucan-specific exo-beta-1,4-glucanase